MRSPIYTVLNTLSFSKKFTLLGLITLMSVGIAMYGFYSNMTNEIHVAKKEYEGLLLTQPIIEMIQKIQQHRGLSTAALSGVEALKAPRISKEKVVAEAFTAMEIHLPVEIKSLDSWLIIANKWKTIQENGMTWSQLENFSAHTQLVNEMLLFKTIIDDDYGLTSDPSLDTHYLAISSTNRVLNVLEYLGQLRALGTMILWNKKITDEYKIKLSGLITLLQYNIHPFKTDMSKVAYYNPNLKKEITQIVSIIENAAQQVTTEVYKDIFSEHFSMSSSDYFVFTTAVIDNSYEQLDYLILPTAKMLIQQRIQHAETRLYQTIIISGVFVLILIYFMFAIRQMTAGSIKALTNAVVSFARGDMSERVNLNTKDEFSVLGNGFNTMADEVVELMSARRTALNLLLKITQSVPGIIYQHRQYPDGSSSLPFASLGIYEILQLTPEDVRDDANKFFSMIHPDNLENVKVSIQQSAENLTTWHHEFRVKLADGTVKWLLGNAISELEVDGATLWHGFITDITARKADEVKIKLLSAAIEQSPASVIITNLDAEIEYVNSRFTEVTGYKLSEIIRKNPRLFQSGLTSKSVYAEMWEQLNLGKPWVGEFINSRKNGDIYYEDAYISAVQTIDGKISHYVAVKLDITERKKYEREINQLAFFDVLTGLPNRRKLLDRMNYSIQLSHRESKTFALLMMDLDKFKVVNDTLGHAAGDDLLKQVAVRITEVLRETDMVARLGGDEFVIVLGNCATPDDAGKVATTVITNLTLPFTLSDGNVVQIGASIGISFYPQYGTTPEGLIDAADHALYHAKEQGRGCYKMFNSEKDAPSE